MTLVPTAQAPRAGLPGRVPFRPSVVPAAASPLLGDLLGGPEAAAHVLAALPTALYLAVEAPLGPRPRPHVLPVLTSDAVLLPTGLVLGRHSGHVDWGVRPGDLVAVGGGRVQLPALTVAAVRRRRPPRVLPLAAGRRPVVPDGGASDLAAAAADLVAGTLAGDDPGAGVRGLVGRGRGLTPSGDDTLCGVLLALRAAADPAARAARRALTAALAPLLPRTTALSASLLLAAAEGYAVPQVVRLVSAAVSGDAAGVARTLPDVLRIGHSSGGDLVAGLSGALRSLPNPPGPTVSDPDPRGVLP